MGKRRKSINIPKSKRPKFTKYKTKFNKNMKFKDGDFFEVEAIRGRKGLDTDPQYLVKWQGWPELTNTWEKAISLKNVKELVYNYELDKNPLKVLKFLDEIYGDFTSEILSESDPEGDVDTDVPFKIHRMKWNEDDNILIEVEWMTRTESGFKPENSWMSSKYFRKDDNKANALMLTEFYEKFVSFYNGVNNDSILEN